MNAPLGIPQPHSPTPLLFPPRKSPPSAPFAAVLLKKLGKTPTSRGRGHRGGGEEENQRFPPSLCCSCSGTRPVIRGKLQFPFPPVQPLWLLVLAVLPSAEGTFGKHFWPRAQHPEASYLHLRLTPCCPQPQSHPGVTATARGQPVPHEAPCGHKHSSLCHPAGCPTVTRSTWPCPPCQRQLWLRSRWRPARARPRTPCRQ